MSDRRSVSLSIDDMDSRSSASTGISEFVKRRYYGQVPVFGGDPRVGISELASSIGHSASGSRTVAALADLFASLRQPSASPDTGQPSHIRMEDRDTLSCVTEDFEAAASLSDERLQLLLDASLVRPADVAAYRTLLLSARKSVRRKQEAIAMAAMRKEAMGAGVRTASDRDLEVHTAKADAFLLKYDLTEDVLRKDLLIRALVHESATGGAMTNQVLAMIGDAVLRLELSCRRHAVGTSAADLSAALSSQQSNAQLRDVALAAGLDKWVTALAAVDVTSRKILATALEALYGAAWLTGRMGAVEQLNLVFKVFVD